MFAIVYGSAIYGGLQLIGPFKTREGAIRYARIELPKTIIVPWEVVELERCDDTLRYKTHR